MYKKHLLQNIEREIVLLKRLALLIEEKDLDFRPNEKVRSTHELMQYLSGIGSTMLRWFLEGLTPEQRAELREHNKSVTIQDFPLRLDKQWETIQQVMAGVTEEDLMNKEVELPWKEVMPLGSAIINAPIKFLAVYRMELFVYLKLNGHTEIGTKEAWVN